MIKHSVTLEHLQVNIEKLGGRPMMSLISYSAINEHNGMNVLENPELTNVHFEDINQLKLFVTVLSKAVETVENMDNASITHFRVK